MSVLQPLPLILEQLATATWEMTASLEPADLVVLMAVVAGCLPSSEEQQASWEALVKGQVAEIPVLV